MKNCLLFGLVLEIICMSSCSKDDMKVIDNVSTDVTNVTSITYEDWIIHETINEKLILNFNPDKQVICSIVVNDIEDMLVETFPYKYEKELPKGSYTLKVLYSSSCEEVNGKKILTGEIKVAYIRMVVAVSD